MRKMKYLYFSVVLFCAAVLLCYSLFDIIGYFENKYKIHELDIEKEPVYRIYEIRMGHVLLWYRLVFFSAVLTMMVFSFIVYLRHQRFSINRFIPLVILITSVIYLLGMIMSGLFQPAVIMSLLPDGKLEHQLLLF